MKKFLVLFFSIFICSITHADTETINWYVDGTSYATTTCQTGGDIILPNTPTKYGYTFQGWAEPFTRIEYLESTGTQYIDTGYTYTDKISFNCAIERYSGGWYFGCRFVNTATTQGNMRAFFFYEDGRLAIRYGQEASNSSLSVPSYKKIVLDFNGETLKVDNVNFISVASRYNTVSFGDIYVFWANTANYYSADVSPFAGKIYYFKIYDNDVLVRDFIPVLDENNVPCMFDRVTQQFFYNQGTGNFIAGPVINQ